MTLLLKRIINTLKNALCVVARVVSPSYLYPNNILQSLKLFAKIPITFFLSKGLSGKNLIKRATDHSGSVNSKEFRDRYRKFTIDDDVILIDVSASKLYIN